MPRGSRNKPSKVEEIEETDEIALQEKAKKLAALIRSSKHCVVHTGAGISTSAAIPDFRGPTGVWTLKDQGLTPNIDIEFEEAFPTYAHMAIYELQKRGFVKYIISQNVDGLHLRSGIPRDKLSELHGNVYLEHCEICHFQYLRDFDSAQDADDDHYSGRKCEQPGCAGKLLDSIIDFGEDLPEEDLKRAEENASQSDLALVLGSSLLVTPASTLPQKTLKNKGKLVIVNLQATKYDSRCEIRFFAKIDRVMQLVMAELGIEVPIYKLESKKIMVGNTTEIIEEKPRKGNKRARASSPASSSASKRVTFFVCGEYGYACPLIESISVKLEGLQNFVPIVTAISRSNSEIKFSGKSQGDLIYMDYMIEESGSKRQKTELGHESLTTRSLEATISFKPYCNAAPVRCLIPLDLSEGVHERVLNVKFCDPSSAEFSTSETLKSTTKSLDELQ
eukprot:TRINITY_DN10717_c0_g1_i1.p1 TRINITY_DN10717_c0_g1~~TRINITY_DN10717_c0_g1_i1.p1  ORF type:complete len:449 (+),score=79.02 TRINITY_DN10717_c0_g1_i1:32-1378(+)